MKISDGIKIKGACTEIPDCSRDDLPEFFKEMGYTVGAEVGVYKGEFSKKFCEAGFKFYAIDPWLAYADYRNPRGQARLDFQYDHVKRLLEPYPNCTIIRKTSMDALADIPDGSLDFVYIDGNHWFKYVAEDICEWAKKVRVGGVVCGHDYVYKGRFHRMGICHVRYVVDAYTLAYGIQDWYVLGRKNTIEGEKRDECRSFMWIKQADTVVD
jgi:hypothetical protein